MGWPKNRRHLSGRAPRGAGHGVLPPVSILAIACIAGISILLGVHRDVPIWEAAIGAAVGIGGIVLTHIAHARKAGAKNTDAS